MAWRLLADLVVGVHSAFIAFVVAGGFLTWRWPRLGWIHVPAAAWGTLIELAGWICPLTPLENHLRHRAGDAGYAGGFIEHYVIPIVYPAGLTRPLQIALGVGALALNLVAYGGLWWKTRRRGAPI